MENDIRRRYGAVRLRSSEDTSVTVLHIGEDETVVATGLGAEPDAVLVLAIGSRRTAADFFKHAPPTPGELEAAIMAVEDEVARARSVATGKSHLFTTDTAIREIAQLAGVAAGSELILSLEAVERLFDLLAALSLGRPASSAGIPANTAFAATLLILREFMHHLQFSSITVQA
jgi:exopolyphosphatase/pppGpp-phosphohydrolase